MQQIKNPNPDSLSPVGYYVSDKEKKAKFYKHESHIYKQGPLSGVKAGVHKLTNDIFTYFPKGFSGSKNSDFYEYLSLGMVPYIIGSAMLIALRCAANKNFNQADSAAAGEIAKRAGAGVVLYGIGKWLSQKVSRALVHHSTGIPLDMRYIKKVNEVPEPGREKGLVRTQYPGVYDSVDFYRKDLLAKDGELNYHNVYHHSDIAAKKAGYKNKLNASNQTMNPKIKELKSRETALENISKYVSASLGVALGFQKAFGKIKIKEPKSYIYALKNGFIQLWQGTNRNLITKHYGKALIIGSVLSALLTWIIPSKEFKKHENTLKSTVDTTKEYEVG